MNHFDRVTDRRGGIILWVVKIKPRVEGVVFWRGRAFEDLEKAEFEAAVHVREYVFGLFPAVFDGRVATILKRGQFFEAVLVDEPAAQVGAAFVGLESARNEQ